MNIGNIIACFLGLSVNYYIGILFEFAAFKVLVSYGDSPFCFLTIATLFTYANYYFLPKFMTKMTFLNVPVGFKL